MNEGKIEKTYNILLPYNSWNLPKSEDDEINIEVTKLLIKKTLELIRKVRESVNAYEDTLQALDYLLEKEENNKWKKK